MAMSIFTVAFPAFIIVLAAISADPVNAFGIGRKQAAGAIGTLLCYGVPPPEPALLELYDEDTFDPDDLMASTVTDPNGEFAIFGYTHEITEIAPKLIIYHKCNTPCMRKFTMYIPEQFVESGVSKPSRPYDIATLELAGQFSDESEEC